MGRAVDVREGAFSFGWSVEFVWTWMAVGIKEDETHTLNSQNVLDNFPGNFRSCCLFAWYKLILTYQF